eukprot:TRINITY_DN5976_c0_g1_i6.p1 TRINITY_DN5976_c0_g1~~TRINITY_DN5976_c0_g1_i6.p1  ORF type:complete len:184 (+),score=14.46 TRINITY_DN5976_c0_g1_i6:192-743(+)
MLVRRNSRPSSDTEICELCGEEVNHENIRQHMELHNAEEDLEVSGRRIRRGSDDSMGGRRRVRRASPPPDFFQFSPTHLSRGHFVHPFFGRDMHMSEEEDHGLNEDELSQLPESKFAGAKGAAEIKCLICQEDFQVGETLRTLICFHRFHKTCIDPWLKKKDECPVCRRGFREKNEQNSSLYD